MKLNDLKPAKGSKKTRRRVGRGLGSGRGKTAGRGQKGQKSRSGFSQGAGWEGGHSRLVMRLPKRGFTNTTEPIQIVNLVDLNRFEDGTTVDAELLVRSGLVRRADHAIKLLGNGELERKLTIDLDAISRSAAQAVAAAGGTVTGPAGATGENTGGEAARSEATAPASASEGAPAEAAASEADTSEGDTDEGDASDGKGPSGEETA